MGQKLFSLSWKGIARDLAYCFGKGTEAKLLPCVCLSVIEMNTTVIIIIVQSEEGMIFDVLYCTNTIFLNIKPRNYSAQQ